MYYPLSPGVNIQVVFDCAISLLLYFNISTYAYDVVSCDVIAGMQIILMLSENEMIEWLLFFVLVGLDSH